MARVLLGDKETQVAERVEDILNRIANSAAGIRSGSILVAPPGWIILTTPDTGGQLYVQAACIGYVRED